MLLNIKYRQRIVKMNYILNYFISNYDSEFDTVFFEDFKLQNTHVRNHFQIVDLKTGRYLHFFLNHNLVELHDSKLLYRFKIKDKKLNHLGFTTNLEKNNILNDFIDRLYLSIGGNYVIT